jgi:hypothetical protein
MPRKKTNDWLSEEYSEKQERKPTLRQYLKELPNDVTDIKSTVRIVWTPGQWDNYTLECDHFRVIVNRKHKLYAALRDNFDAFSKGTETLDVLVTDRKSVTYRLSTNPKESGEWFFIGGDAGLKFTSVQSDAGNPNAPF